MNRPLRPAPTAWLHPHCAVALAILCWGLAPNAARACRTELVGEPAAAWHRALQRISLADDACDLLHLELVAGQARLLFTTRDGRQAVRLLGAPSELAPTIDALLVTSAPSAPATTATEPNTPAPATPTPTEQPVATARAHDLAPLVALLAGARAGRKVPAVSPLLNLEGLLRIDRWEIGLQLGWEVKYYDLMQGGKYDEADFGLVPALSFARRHPLGRSALLLGARAGLAAMIAKHRRSSLASRVDPDVAPLVRSSPPTYQGWTGLLLGVVFPELARLRLRAELAADLSFATRYPYSTRYEPGWSLSLSIGAEFGRS